MTTVTDRAERIVKALVEALIVDGKEALSIREIAERIDSTPTKVSNAAWSLFNTDNGWVRIMPTTVHVDVHERNYGSVTHQRSCRGYQVTLGLLASIIRKALEDES